MSNSSRPRDYSIEPLCRRSANIDASLLENRILWSASPIVVIDPEPGLDPNLVESAAVVQQPVSGLTTAPPNRDLRTEPSFEVSSRRLELAFIDAEVHDLERVLQELSSQRNEERDLEIFLLDDDRNGIEQIAEILSGFQDIDAVHLFSHGKDGNVKLGNTWLNNENLSAHASDLTRWAWAMSPHADLLLYGCDVARTETGEVFIHALSILTETDVAASDDNTGSESLGGDWNLEYQLGTITSAMNFSAGFQTNWNSLLAVTAEDPFNTTGLLNGSNGGSGWNTGWSGGGFNLQMNGRSLSDSTGQLLESGGSVRLNLTTTFSTTISERETTASHGNDGTTTWLSFVVEPGDTGLASHMGLEFGSTGVDVAFAGYNGTGFVLEEAGGASRQTVAGLSAVSGQSFFIVLRIDAVLGNDTITMYVNPTPGLASPSTAYSVTKTNLDLGNWTRFAIAGGRGTSVNNAFFDELRIGTSFADVSPALSVANVAPVITSNGGGNSATLNVAENSTAVTTIAASDANLPAPTITYSITGGDDQNLFAIDSATGELEFIAPPNYENPLDANHDNIYLVTVQVSDGSLVDTQTVSIIVTDVNESTTSVTDEYWIGEDQSLSASVSNGWYNNSWTIRQRISIDNSSGATLTDQVILVQLNSSNIDYSCTQSAGQDLRFIDSDGTVLDYEIESWDEAGTSRVWIRVPQIDGFSGSDFVWMYYGNASATDGQSAEAVWERDATAIVHFGPTVTDSSPEVNPITVVEATNSTGYIGQSRSFDGVNDAISLGSDSEIDDLFTGGGTLSAWIRPEGWGENNYGRIASKASSTFALSTLGDGWNFQVNGNDGSLLFEYGFSSSVGEWRTAAGSISLHQWQHVAVVYDSSSAANNPRIFIDGVEVSVTRSGSPSGTPTSDAALPLRIGNQALTDDRTFDGLIDEFRAFSTSLTVTQIQADYRSMAGTLISIGSPEEGPGGVLNNDADPDSHPLTAVLISGPTHASAFTFQNDGTFSYTPNANYFGDDLFVYSVTDGVHTSGPIQATIHVSSRPDGPIITSNGGGSTALVSITETNSFVTMVTSTDVDSPSVLYSMETSLDSSRFSIHATTGQLQFIAAPSFASPTDSNGDNVYLVRVRVSDGGLYDEQLIAIHVNPLPIVVNHDPIGVVDNYTTFEDEPLLVVLRGVLANDSDPDGDPLKAILSSTTSHGDLTLNADGSFTYLPDANYEGIDQFSYRVFDGNNHSDPTTVAIVVHAVNDAPLARDDFFVMLNDSRLLVDLPGVLSNDSDVENDTLSTVVDRGPLHGSLLLLSNGTFEYEPEPGFSGVDRFTYTSTTTRVDPIPPPSRYSSIFH